MGTRHNVVFMGNEFTTEDENGNKKTYNKLKFNKDGTVSLKCLKNCPKVYVHWDGYPSGALPILQEFLQTDGARTRMHDEQYLSAYYVAWKIIHHFGHTNLKSLDDFRGIGIETSLNDWCDFTYIIKPETIMHNTYKFTIYVLDYNLKLLKKIEHINDLEEYKEEEWWY